MNYFASIGLDISINIWGALKVMPPILLCWPTVLKGGSAVGVEQPVSITCCCCVTDAAEGHSDRTVSEMEVGMKQKYVTEFWKNSTH